MEDYAVHIETVLDYIVANLDGQLDLEMVFEVVHYSKYHLHRMFTSTVGMTIHDYVQRRQLSEAAKPLVISDMQGRVFELTSSLYSCCYPIGMALFGPLADSIPLGGIMIFSGVVLLLVGGTVYCNNNLNTRQQY